MRGLGGGGGRGGGSGGGAFLKFEVVGLREDGEKE